MHNHKQKALAPKSYVDTILFLEKHASVICYFSNQNPLSFHVLTINVQHTSIIKTYYQQSTYTCCSHCSSSWLLPLVHHRNPPSSHHMMWQQRKKVHWQVYRSGHPDDDCHIQEGLGWLLCSPKSPNPRNGCAQRDGDGDISAHWHATNMKIVRNS